MESALLLPHCPVTYQIRRKTVLSELERILSKVKEYIDKNLDSKSRNILNLTKDDFEKVPEISEILAELNVTEREYCGALSISNDSGFQIHLKRQQNICFINNFFSEGLFFIEFETMKAIAKAYSTMRECSVQEAICYILPERKIFLKVIFLNPNMLEKRYSIFKEKCRIDELPEDSTEIFHRNMLDRYLYGEISNTCFSEFLSSFDPKSRTIRDLENDH